MEETTRKLVIVGPPACGKGTQAQKLRSLYKDMTYVSTGDLLREAIRKECELGRRAKDYMERGELVPDELVNELVKAKLSGAPSYLLDGYPRDLEQARALELINSPTLVLELRIPDPKLVRRVCGRLVHPGSGRTYHTMTHPPQKEGVDDVTGEPLVRRSDDNEGALKQRLVAYHKQTEPVLKFYSEKLAVIDADGTEDEVFERIQSVLLKGMTKDLK